MANTITAKIGADTAPLKKGMAEAVQMTEATAKKFAAAKKRQAEEDKKQGNEAVQKFAAAKKRQAEEDKKQAKEASAGARGFAGELTRAGTAAEALGVGVTRATEGLKLGVVGGIAVGVLSAIIGKVDEAVDSATRFRDAMAKALAPRGGTAGTSIGGIQGQLASGIAAGAALQERGENPWATTVKDHIGNGANWVTSKLGLTERATQGLDKDPAKQAAIARSMQNDVDRLAQKSKDLAAIEAVRVTNGEHAARLKQIELERTEKIGDALRLASEIKDKTGIAINTNGISKQANAEAAQKVTEANRQAGFPIRDMQDQAAREKAAVGVAGTAPTSKLGAIKMQMDELNAEMAKQNRYADEAGENFELWNQHLANAKTLESQIATLEIQRGQLQRSIDAAQADSGFAKRQAEINVLATTDKQLATKKQIALLEDQVAENTKRKALADEQGKAAIDGQNAALNAQAKILSHGEATKSPAQRRAEARAAKHAEHVGAGHARANAAIADDRERTRIRNGGAPRIQGPPAPPAVLAKPAAGAFNAAAIGDQIGKAAANAVVAVLGKGVQIRNVA